MGARRMGYGIFSTTRTYSYRTTRQNAQLFRNESNAFAPVHSKYSDIDPISAGAILSPS